MKKIMIAVLLVLGMGVAVKAEVTWSELFRETEGKVVDWAIASSVEPVYYFNMAQGINEAGAQMPVLYVTPYLSADFGYVSRSDDRGRGTLSFGGSLRVNRIIELFFSDKVNAAKSFLPQRENLWDRLFLGPYVAHNFTASELTYGVKGGLKF